MSFKLMYSIQYSLMIVMRVTDAKDTYSQPYRALCSQLIVHSPTLNLIPASLFAYRLCNAL